MCRAPHSYLSANAGREAGGALGDGGEGGPAADALGEEGVAVGGGSATTLCSWPKSSNEITAGPADWSPNEPRSQRQVIDDFARAAGVGQVRVGEIPSVVLRGMGLVWPLMRELRETEYQFRDDFVMDSSAAQATFGLKPAPWEEIVADTIHPASR